MIRPENLRGFVERNTARKQPTERRVPASSPQGRGIAESPDTLRAYLEAHGVKVRTTKRGQDGATVLILDGCPMNPDHGAGTDTAVVLRSNGVIGFACKHNSCALYTWADVRARIDPDHKALAEVAEGATSWEPPVPLGRFELPGFPLEAIPSALAAFRDLCSAVAESYQVPVDLPAMLGLAVGGAALAKRVEVHVRGDHIEPVNLYVAVAMEPGERKSQVFRVVSAPLVEFERKENERLAPTIAQNANERAILEASLRHAQNLAAKAKKAEDRQQDQQRARDLIEQLQELPTLHAPKYIADDATPEALGKLLFQQAGRIAILSPEGDTFELMAGRYDRKGAPNLGVYLKGHIGDDLRVDRVAKDRPAEHVVRPAVTVGLAVQPEVLRGLMDKPGFRGRGLLGRFLYSMPKSRVGYRKVAGAAVPTAVLGAYDRLVRAALQLQPATDSSGKPCPQIVRVGPEALVELDRFAGVLEREVRESGGLAAMRDWANKLVGAVCRIGGIFHGLTFAPGGGVDGHALDAETILCAMAIGEYAIAHARAAYFEMGADPAIGLARRILAWLAEERPAEFTAREAFQVLRGTVHTMDGMVEPLRLLRAHGYIRERPVDHRRVGRKPSTPHEVNPLFYAQNAHNFLATSNSAHSAHCAQGICP